MPKPFVFSSESSLIKTLSSKETLTSADAFFSARVHSIEEVIYTGVTGNTFRAFRKLPTPPSLTFRNWSNKQLQVHLQRISNIQNPTDYAAYVHEATLDLCDVWQRETDSEMGYGRGSKLFNLVLKKLACLDSLTETQRKRLIDLQHVPWDSYTIQGLKEIAPALSIPSNATMKFVVTPTQYQEFQKVISSIAAKAGVPAIYYDILAWDMGHPKRDAVTL